ncbi:beta-carotene 15,15'-monooxygenase [Sphingobacterium oryzagri]|uniref:Beta-carotene 15,15'-monooxygenase n=1 Tax=Sphingobacterium oryzagri TaxID=3025669 RepID=A0ABY7WDS8_9SPHI|nr:beta-carotene 15,15'-monooxygenase [Sphingobacterium sp. KACC 22765]WDF67792.1 beta-carotene 15,15'-monooxygenase [Sphingobacterium sp. KACC 22765]
MLQYLKESTFKANDVVLRALALLRTHYISIASLCFLLFVTSNSSSYLAMTLAESNSYIIKGLFCFIFVTLFFGTQLVLIKRSLLLARGIEHADFMDYIPSTKQFVNFLLGLVLYSFLVGVVYLLSSVISFPLLYLDVEMETLSMEINPFLTGVIMMFVLIRITFYPYFIVDRQVNLFRSFRLSLALTKGNTMRLLLLFLVMGMAYILQASCEYFGYFIMAKMFSIINTFVIIPSVSLVMAVAYHDMMKDYTGGDDPEFLKNII